MKKQLITLLAILFSAIVFGQNVGIGTITPDEKLQVDSVIRVGKNAVIQQGSSRKNTIKFGDGNYATIGEQDKDDRLVLNAGSFSFKSGKVGIGVDSARDVLDVNGGIILGNTNVNVEGGIRYNSLTSDFEYRNNSKWNSTKNNFFKKTSYFFEDNSINTIVDVPGSDLTITEAGTYLVNYFVDAYNTYNLVGTPTNNINKYVYRTDVYLYEKVNNLEEQRMKIDNKEIFTSGTGLGFTELIMLDPHEVSGIVIMQLAVNNKVGIKIKQTADVNGIGTMRVNQCIITAVKLY
jgi:hypothetical protein